MCKTVITGIRATGIPHIGNYLGAIKPILEVQDEYNIFIIVADLHAIPHIKDPKVLNENVSAVTACCLACGLDTEKTVIWRQSQLNEMGMIVSVLSSLTTTQEMDLLMNRQNSKNLDLISYMYPILMAADTLMLDSDYVYAGVDHKEGMALVQSLALRFNKQYGKLFRVPEPMYPPLKEMVKGMDGRKMSKSLNNTITILDTEDNLYEMIMNPMKNVTVTKVEAMEPILKLLSYFVVKEEFDLVKRSFVKNEIDSREVRYHLFTQINRELEPIRQRYQQLINNPTYIDAVLGEGLLKVKKRTLDKVQQMLQKVGLLQ